MRRLSRRRSAGPEGNKPTAAAPGPGDAPDQTPAEPEGRTSLLADPAAPTRELQPGDPLAGPAQRLPHSTGRPEEGAADAAGQPTSRYTAQPGEPYSAQPGASYSTRSGAPSSAGHPHAPYGAGQAGTSDTAIQPETPYEAGGPYGPGEPAAPAPPVADLPPGLDPDELAAVPISSARRGRLRRRVAFLRAARELLLRDLGGFIYELHRTAGDIEHEAHRRLRATKLARLARIDAELHELELRLDDVRRNVVVREPGVGGECPECGELFGSDAHYCSHCGLPLTESARRAVTRAAIAGPAAVAPEPVLPGPAPVAEAPLTTVRPAAGDQPTQQLRPSVSETGTEFRWPARDGTGQPPAGAEDGSDGGGTDSSGDGVTGDADRSAATGGEAVTGPGDSPSAAAGNGEMAGRATDEAAPREDAPVETAGDDDLTGRGEDPAPTAGDDDLTGRGEDPAPTAGDDDLAGRGEDPAPTAGDDDLTGRGDSPADGADRTGGGDDSSSGTTPPSADGGEIHPNGGTPGTGERFSPAERGT